MSLQQHGDVGLGKVSPHLGRGCQQDWGAPGARWFGHCYGFGHLGVTILPRLSKEQAWQALEPAHILPWHR